MSVTAVAALAALLLASAVVLLFHAERLMALILTSVVGVVVDSVSDVLELNHEQIKSAPGLNSSIDAGFITGIGTVRSGEAERMLILVDIEALMGSADMGLVESLG